MLSKKSKGLFVEVNRYSILLATTSSLSPPFVLESLEEFSLDQENDFREYIENLIGQKGIRYLPAHSSCYPVSRFFRRMTVESMAKAKDENYFSDLLQSQYKIDPSRSIFSVLNAQTGEEFDRDLPLQNQKEVLVCGAERKELELEQERLVEAGVFPESLQLGSLSTLAGIKNYLRWKELEGPVLTFEIAPENSNLTILSGEQVDLCRPIPFGIKGMFPLVQQELGLKDEESAKKLFYSDTFDFTEMGPTLLRKVLKELQASTGFYEVQTGQTIRKLFVHVLPKNLKWIPSVIAQEIGIEPMKVDIPGWLEVNQITIGDQIHAESIEGRWFGLLSLMVSGGGHHG